MADLALRIALHLPQLIRLLCLIERLRRQRQHLLVATSVRYPARLEGATTQTTAAASTSGRTIGRTVGTVYTSHEVRLDHESMSDLRLSKARSHAAFGSAGRATAAWISSIASAETTIRTLGRSTRLDSLRATHRTNSLTVSRSWRAATHSGETRSESSVTSRLFNALPDGVHDQL